MCCKQKPIIFRTLKNQAYLRKITRQHPIVDWAREITLNAFAGSRHNNSVNYQVRFRVSVCPIQRFYRNRRWLFVYWLTTLTIMYQVVESKNTRRDFLSKNLVLELESLSMTKVRFRSNSLCLNLIFTFSWHVFNVKCLVQVSFLISSPFYTLQFSFDI